MIHGLELGEKVSNGIPYDSDFRKGKLVETREMNPNEAVSLLAYIRGIGNNLGYADSRGDLNRNNSLPSMAFDTSSEAVIDYVTTQFPDDGKGSNDNVTVEYREFEGNRKGNFHELRIGRDNGLPVIVDFYTKPSQN